MALTLLVFLSSVLLVPVPVVSRRLLCYRYAEYGERDRVSCESNGAGCLIALSADGEFLTGGCDYHCDVERGPRCWNEDGERKCCCFSHLCNTMVL
nr:hypothetical protein [Baylisascaris schroederi]